MEGPTAQAVSTVSTTTLTWLRSGQLLPIRAWACLTEVAWAEEEVSLSQTGTMTPLPSVESALTANSQATFREIVLPRVRDAASVVAAEEEKGQISLLNSRTAGATKVLQTVASVSLKAGSLPEK